MLDKYHRLAEKIMYMYMQEEMYIYIGFAGRYLKSIHYDMILCTHVTITRGPQALTVT